MVGYVDVAVARVERAPAAASRAPRRSPLGRWWLVCVGLTIALVGAGIIAVDADARLAAQRDSILRQTTAIQTDLAQSQVAVDRLRGNVAQLRSSIAALEEQLASTEGFLP